MQIFKKCILEILCIEKSFWTGGQNQAKVTKDHQVQMRLSIRWQTHFQKLFLRYNLWVFFPSAHAYSPPFACVQSVNQSGRFSVLAGCHGTYVVHTFLPMCFHKNSIKGTPSNLGREASSDKKRDTVVHTLVCLIIAYSARNHSK